MNCLSNIESLIKCLEPERTRLEEPMSLHTSLGVGGKAEVFYTTTNSSELVKAVRLARSFQISVAVIDDGCCVVVSDKGVSGLVVKNESKRVQIRPRKSIMEFLRRKRVKKVEVTVDSGVSVGKMCFELSALGIVGLEKECESIGSVGSLVKRGGGKNKIKRISILDDHGGVRSVGPDFEIGEMLVIDVTFLLTYGAKKNFKKKGKRKERCVREVFEDILPDEQEALGYLTCDPAYIVGDVLNMKGFEFGKMKVSSSDPNKIINLGGGTAGDFVGLVEEIKRRARDSIGIELIEKVVRLGEFGNDKISPYGL